MRKTARVVKTLQTTITVILIACALLMTVPRLVGFRAYAVQSGSMEPAIPTGALIWVDEQCDKSSLAAGEIIAYETSSGTLIAHRITSVNANEKTLRTKGDANEAEDAADIPLDSVVGNVSLSIPLLGFATGYLRKQPLNALAALAGIYVILFGIPWACNALKSRKNRRTEPCKQATSSPL